MTVTLRERRCFWNRPSSSDENWSTRRDVVSLRHLNERSLLVSNVPKIAESREYDSIPFVPIKLIRFLILFAIGDTPKMNSFSNSVSPPIIEYDSLNRVLRHIAVVRLRVEIDVSLRRPVGFHSVGCLCRQTSNAVINNSGVKRRSIEYCEIYFFTKAYKIIYREGNTIEKAKKSLTTLAKNNSEINLYIDFINKSNRGLIR